MEENEKRDNILPEFKLNTLIPYFLPFVISLGVFRLMIFYSAFGIRITSFLDFSEIIVSFMDILIILTLVLAWNTIGSKLQFSREEVDKHRKLYDEICAEKSDWKRFKKVVRMHVQMLALFALLFAALFIYGVFKEVPVYVYIYYGIVFSAVIVISFLRVEIDVWHKDFNSGPGHREFMAVLLNAVTYVVIIFATAKVEVNMLKESKHRKKVAIHFNDGSTFVSTDSTYFIGKTANYVFLYSIKENQTDVVPATRINRMEFDQE
jgi:hypothetical protein